MELFRLSRSMIKNVTQASFLCLCLAVVQVNAYAEVYRWVDDRGRVQFSDQAPESKKAEVVELAEISTYQGVTVSEVEEGIESGPVRQKKSIRRKRVVIYSAQWCGMCRKAKNYFKRKKIPFKEYDIEKSRNARRSYDKLNATGIPVILIGKKRMDGFSKYRFDKIYF